MDQQQLKARVFALADEMQPLFEEVCDAVFRHPELGLAETWSSDYLVRMIADQGFSVQKPYCELETAFRAEKGKGGPKIAFLAEYDALPGYGPAKDQTGHACGHNWIAASSFGAAAVLGRLADELGCTAVWIGTPAEETVGGKVDLVRAGAFDDVDLVLQMHLGDRTELRPHFLAMDSVEFTFEGVATHASNTPERGVNALDACNLTFCGINALRQHITPDARIHGIITQGGVAPNITPSHCVARFYVRAARRDYLNGLTEKVINCARGAELMTGAKMSYRYFENPFDDLNNCAPLLPVMEANLRAAGVEEFRDPEPNSAGSSDIGNVSHVCPTLYIPMETGNTDGSCCHDEAFLAHVNGPEAYRALNRGVKGMAATAVDALCDEALWQAVRTWIKRDAEN